jgi:hypothetical protein
MIQVACFQSLQWTSIAKCLLPPPLCQHCCRQCSYCSSCGRLLQSAHCHHRICQCRCHQCSYCSSCCHCCGHRHCHYCHHHCVVIATVASPSPLCNIFCGDCKRKKLLSYVFILFCLESVLIRFMTAT